MFIVTNNVIVGIYNGVLSKEGKYQALVGLELLEQGGIDQNVEAII